MLSMEELATFCKKKGFVYPSSDIYGGIKGFFDLGPYGVELMNNIKQSWWSHFVRSKENITGMDASIISNPKIWQASGHVENFQDISITDSKTKEKFRADQYIEEKLNINAEGMSAKEINDVIKKNNLKTPKGNDFLPAQDFNLMFSTQIGADEGSSAFLRGETAQGMFTNFKIITDTTRQTLPFGIAQIGKCFRNEIAPRDFLFRSREFTIGELEFFIHPDEKKCPELTKVHKELSVQILDAETQEKDKVDLRDISINDMLNNKKLEEWHAYWLAEQMMWLHSVGLKNKDLKIREHMKKELSHYSSATFDIDFNYPFGSKELAGNANRGQYDLSQHIKASKEKLEIFDEDSKKKVVPSVIEPTFGMERVFLALLTSAYEDDKKRGNIVLKINPKLAPVKVAVFPLVNKLNDKARGIFSSLKNEFACSYDKSGSIGRRYARADELGIPFCVTLDFEDDGCVTVRNRDTTEQERVKIEELKDRLKNLLSF